MLGLLPRQGEVTFAGAPVRDSADLRGKLAFVPQFSISHDLLTVDEALRYALDLCVVDAAVKAQRRGEILKRIGLAEHRQSA